MKRKQPRTRFIGRMTMPALFCLITALLLAGVHRLDGDETAFSLLKQLGSNHTFASAALSWECGMTISPPIVHAPHTLTEGIVSEDTVEEEYEAESDISECAYAETTAPVSKDFSASEVKIKTSTPLSFNIPSMLQNPISIRKTSGPQVLIYHTHSTEAYTPDQNNPYPSSDNYRTTDTKYNVVRVGDELTKVLEAKGISVIHCRKLFDSPAYNGSYGRSLSEIETILKQNPSLQVVIDLHRDAIMTATGTTYATSCQIDGKKMAQLMLVIGSNDMGLKHDNWPKNLNYAVNLQSRLLAEHPGLMRDISLRTQRFNQHLRIGSFLIEVGSCGNSLPEAIEAVKLFGQSLADDLNGA